MNYNQKKQLLLELLQQLNGYWDQAPAFITLLMLTDPEESMLEGIIAMISQAIASVSDAAVQQQAQILLHNLEEMLKQEKAERAQEEKDAEQTIHQLDTL